MALERQRRPTPANFGDVTDSGGWTCVVTSYGVGEHPWEGGGRCGGGRGGGEEGDEELAYGSGGDCTVVTKCGDARDGLAKEYADKEDEIWGSWPCTKFKKDHPQLIGVGTADYHSSHEGYGLINPALPSGIAKTEAHFNISMVYTSGYRCPEKNAAVSESANPYRSHHIFGQAVDFKTATGWTAARKDTIYKWGLTNAVESRNYSLADGNHNHLAWR